MTEKADNLPNNCLLSFLFIHEYTAILIRIGDCKSQQLQGRKELTKNPSGVTSEGYGKRAQQMEAVGNRPKQKAIQLKMVRK
jgi:hypothetical protein